MGQRLTSAWQAESGRGCAAVERCFVYGCCRREKSFDPHPEHFRGRENAGKHPPFGRWGVLHPPVRFPDWI